MKIEAEGLRLVRLELDTTGLYRLVRRWKLPLRNVDLGYLVHCGLAGLFGKLAPKAFRVLDASGSMKRAGGRSVEVLGYATVSASEMEDAAKSFAAPDVYRCCHWAALADKPLPSSWAPRRRLGFEVRVCPVVRKASHGSRHRKGAEVDAFLSACWDVGDPSIPVDREAVYRDWLERRLGRGDGARIVDAGMTRFRRTRLLRRAQGRQRKTRILERPDAVFRGTLEVVNGGAFAELLGHGVGRHRAFGFGMLLLRPPGRA